jgi:hypothetical protein
VGDLILGPLLRHVGDDGATVWVETGAACEVEVKLGGASHRARTFRVKGHHYALVHVGGLEAGTAHEYSVFIEGEKKWPEEGSGFPPSFVRAPAPGEAVKLVFGSCRISAPHEAPYTLERAEDGRGLGVDALYATATPLLEESVEEYPHALVLLGDQIYAHKPPESTLDFIRSRRDPGKAPGEVVADFEEYARLYRDVWGEPAIRWLLSTVPSAMIFDDHEVGDDWNISEAWVEEMRANPWWDAQIIGGYASYWIYQHIGNLSPKELADDDLFSRITASEDGWPLLEDFGYRTHRRTEGTRWSFHRDFGGVRLVMVDSRGGRVLDEGKRSMVDAEEWRWIEDKAAGGFDHLLIGTSLPLLLSPGMHHLQSANEAVCAGAWGGWAAKRAENLRRSQDLDHWASFHSSFTGMTDLIRRVATGEKGSPPSSVTVLSGDVHHSYIAEAELRDARSAVYQVVCSPLRNSLPGEKSRLQRGGWTEIGKFAGRMLARLAGVEDPGIRWRLLHDEPWFENAVATLKTEGRSARLTFEKAVLDASGKPALVKIHERRLS